MEAVLLLLIGLKSNTPYPNPFPWLRVSSPFWPLARAAHTFLRRQTNRATPYVISLLTLNRPSLLEINVLQIHQILLTPTTLTSAPFLSGV